MSRFLESLLATVLAAGVLGAHAQGKDPFPGIGRDATPAEVKAWNIDVRPDFQGLPKGSGSVAKGQVIWEGKCASCHGVFGESNEVFQPLIGGTTAEDIKTGHVAALKRPDVERTMIMKLPTVSTLWDYINRAMPWTAPKSLSTDEVYAVTAYLLNLGGVLPDDYVLSDRTIAEVQQRLPNRNGMTTQHAMWPGNEFSKVSKPDVVGSSCMTNCPVDGKVTSMLPDFAMNAHGNLADQIRLIGPARGLNTAGPKDAAKAPAALPAKSADAAPANPQFASLTQKNNCTACHAPDHRVVGPSWGEIAKKHEGRADYLVGKIRSGGSGVWGAIPMPPQTAVPEEDIKRIASLLAGVAH